MNFGCMEMCNAHCTFIIWNRYAQSGYMDKAHAHSFFFLCNSYITDGRAKMYSTYLKIEGEIFSNHFFKIGLCIMCMYIFVDSGVEKKW